MMKRKVKRYIYDTRRRFKYFRIFNMKIFVITVCFFIVSLFVLSCWREQNDIMELCYNFSISYNNGTVEYLAVVVHRSEIKDIEECAKEIIEHCEKDDFKTIRFNYDTGEYPCEIHATVYLNKEDFDKGNYVFKMAYKQDPENKYKYNIIDNPEKFYLIID